MTKIIDKLNIKGKISAVHAEEIEEIIQGELNIEFFKGYNKGVRWQKQHIDEGVKKLKKYPITEKAKPKRDRPHKYPQFKVEKIYWGNDIYNQALEDIKQLNK